MKPSGMPRIVLALVSAVVVFAILVGIDYLRDVIIGKGAFSPNWPECIFGAILVALLSYFGPDAAQRRRNRWELTGRMTESASAGFGLVRVRPSTQRRRSATAGSLQAA